MLTSGTIIVTDSEAFGGNGGLIAVDPVSGRQTTLAQGGLFRDPAGLAVARDGTIVVSDLVAFDGTGGLISVEPATGRQTRSARPTRSGARSGSPSTQAVRWWSPTRRDHTPAGR